MRLIDADMLIEEIEKIALEVEQQTQGRRNGKTLAQGILFGFGAMRKTVLEQPTAYDQDKIVEKLEEVEKIMTSPVNEDCFGEECRASDCTVCVISKAIEIVKGGGVDAF